MTNEQPAGFWSYTRRDDQLDGGRITRLSERIANAFEIITGEPLEIFIDKKSIEWGDAWRARLDSALTGTTFLIPIVTPKFLQSQECRREVIKFAGHAASLGLEELLLPIHYVNVPQLAHEVENQPADEVVELIAKRQWVDWRELRLEDEDSPAYRQAVHKLATKLAEILENAPPATPVEIASPNQNEEDPPGFLEIMAEMEATLPAWQDTVQQFSAIIELIGTETQQATDEISLSDSRGGGFAGRMRVTEELTNRLTDPVRKVDELGTKYWAELSTIDPGVIGIIRQSSQSNLSTEDKESAREFFKVIQELAGVTRGTSAQLQSFSDNVGAAAQGSRQLRPQFRTIQAAVQKVIDGQAIIDEWSRMIGDMEEGEE
ncbi:toll/interleukin-1 receptor domain-containing protein [Streptomyces sp. NP-1717]|uniref:toll/interleukin-1 receptor domain-containing protein n=1 Tax=Streptomyces sp. NP-1717 TaxID=2704470 RepID=UPI001F5D7CF1|nr:toll/interleukin-1 receptor domain-containing protein [Streptomyces sp. NP-1717]MCI3222508.1 TIR domain-containing protein [Streptomyces sp. NP-1717]